ncbi:insulin-like growth factor-binding protein 2-A [Thalassophryne amazonica]|uniref:insulin-like growth factor-binding protein 2-A n=1 Tax=Thalassophryne amazonica TaxID=390379 RepID=UPI001470F805|nr:insulin-like growth factor-binding protein 2-A [Thalassophryne amazonica]
MIIYFTFSLLFAFISLPGNVLGDLVFRCPTCTAEHLSACLIVTAECAEIVREPGCGCCPVCAKLQGDLCGVYTPRCSTGLMCYPSPEAEFPLQELLQGLGRCGQILELEVPARLDQQHANNLHVTEGPLLQRPPLDPWLRQEIAKKQHQNDLNSKMKKNQLQEPQIQRLPQGACQQELDKVLEEISKMTAEDNRGPLESLYELKFPNCDIYGLYNIKQCNMSTHGQRGECWCVNPVTGIQIPETPKVRGDPNCNQLQEELRVMPTATAFY